MMTAGPTTAAVRRGHTPPRVRRRRRAAPSPAAPSLVAFLVLAALVVAGCGGGGEQAAEQPPLRMVGNENMAFLETPGGVPTGFSADLAAAIAKHLGRKLEVTIRPFPELLPLVQEGKFDIAMSAITISPEREQVVAFSDPYFDSGQALLVPRDSTVKTLDDLRGATVGALADSTNQEQAESIPGVRLVMPFDDKVPMFDALVAGAIDAVVCDTPFALYNVKQTGKTRIAQLLTQGDKYGIALRKGDDTLLVQVNEALTALRADGTYGRLYRTYFGR